MTHAQKLARLERILRRRDDEAKVARHARDDAIRTSRSEGMGVREIARVLDIDPSQVVRICKR